MTVSRKITVRDFCGLGRAKSLFSIGLLAFTTFVTVLVVKKPKGLMCLIYNDIFFGFYNRLVLGGTQVSDFIAFILRPFLRHLISINTFLKQRFWTSPVNTPCGCVSLDRVTP